MVKMLDDLRKTFYVRPSRMQARQHGGLVFKDAAFACAQRRLCFLFIPSALLVLAFNTSCATLVRRDEKIPAPALVQLNKGVDAGSVKANFAAANIIGNFKYEENLVGGLSTPKLFVEAAFFDATDKNPMFGKDREGVNFHSVGPAIEFFETTKPPTTAEPSAAIPSNSMKYSAYYSAANSIREAEYRDIQSEGSDDTPIPPPPTNGEDKSTDSSDDTSDDGPTPVPEPVPGDETDDKGDDPTDDVDPLPGDKPVPGSTVKINEMTNSKDGVIFYFTPGGSADLLPSVSRKHGDATTQHLRILDNQSPLGAFTASFSFPSNPVKITSKNVAGGALKIDTGKDFELTWEPGGSNSIVTITVEIREEIKGKSVVTGTAIIYSPDSGKVAVTAKELAKLPDGAGIASIARIITGNIDAKGDKSAFINYKSAFKTLLKVKKGPPEAAK